jgi:acyl-coenzyme A thioesterase PaaI-like protein
MLPLADVEDLNQLLESRPFTQRYGFRVMTVGYGTCEMLVPYLPEHDRPGDIVSGQVYMHAADVAFWLSVKTRLGMADEYVTSNMTTAFLGSARGHEFTCHARVIKAGRRLIYGEAECRAGDKTLTHHTLTYVSAG